MTHTASRAVTVRIGAELTISGLPRELEQMIVASCTLENPAYIRKQRMGLSTWDTDQYLGLYRRTAAGLVVGRGTYPMVVRACRDRGVPFSVVDETIAPPLGLEVAVAGVLFEYQQRGLDALLRWPTGLLESPTGSGKTNILLSAIPRLGTRTLILVHTQELLQQMQARCRSWLGVEPGILGGGKWDVQPITIGMIQTLAKRDLREIADCFGAVLTDECHHVAAHTWAEGLSQFPARYKYGCTATAWRKDRLQSVIFKTLSPITASISQAEVTAAGNVIAPDVAVVNSAFSFEMASATEWGRMLSALVRDTNRNQLVANTVRHRLMPDTHAVVLTDRIEHVGLLAALLRDLDPVVLTGNMPQATRDAGMAAIRAGARVTIATAALLGEGVDVPGWDLLVMASPMAGGPRTLQAVGRVCRAAPGKQQALVVDVHDPHVPALVAAAAQRERLYVGVRRVA